MEGSDRIFLRNRRFLEKDPSFNTQQLNMLRREVEHEGLGGRGPAEDSTATEFSTSLPRKPALRSNGVATQPGGGLSLLLTRLRQSWSPGRANRPLLLPWRTMAAGKRSSLAPRSLLLTSLRAARAVQRTSRAARRPLQLALSCSPQGPAQGQSSWPQRRRGRRSWL